MYPQALLILVVIATSNAQPAPKADPEADPDQTDSQDIRNGGSKKKQVNPQVYLNTPGGSIITHNNEINSGVSIGEYLNKLTDTYCKDRQSCHITITVN